MWNICSIEEEVLDEKDIKILEELTNNASQTTRQIAKKTYLPITTVHNRIRKLRKEKVIEKYTIIPNYHAIGKGFLVYILIHASLPLLKAQKRTQYDIAKDLTKFDFIHRVDIVSGGSDLIALVRVKDVQEYDTVLLTKIQKVKGIEKTQSLIVIHEG